MAEEKAALRVTELDFLEIKENLKTFLRSQEQFADFDFDGAGMNVLLDILAYNTHYMAFYQNMIANEMFIDSAQLRPSVISHAKLMNYVPSGQKGATAIINIQAAPSLSEDNDRTTITLDKYTKLMGSDIDGVNYPFVTIRSNTVSKTNGSFSFSNVHIKQGEVVTLQYEMTSGNEARRFEIPSANVDSDTIVVYVQESSTNTDVKLYSVHEDITELTANTLAYFLEENENGFYSFYFGDDVIGKKPKNGSIIICTYLDNVGILSNNINNFVFVESVGGEYSDNVTVSVVSSSRGASSKETIENIRFRAPYAHTAQNRAVTSIDYESLLIKDYNYIDAVSVWGGEDNDPPVYGKVYMSIKTKGNYALTNLEKEIIKNDLIEKRNVLSIIPEIVDPDYTYILLRGKVYYDSRLTSLDADELLATVRTAVEDYIDDELNTFESVFRKSKLVGYIENSEKSITGSDIDVYLQKRADISVNTLQNYTLNYLTTIAKGDMVDKIYTRPQVTVYDNENISRNVYFEEIPESSTGISSIDIVNPGINYTTAPTVTITGDGIGASATAVIVNGRIDRIDVDAPGANYTRATVSITGGGGSEGTAVVKLENNEGTLRSYYFRTNGEKVIVNNNAGTIDYNAGKITIRELYAIDVVENDFYDNDVLTINVPTHEDNIFPKRNRILTLDINDTLSIQLEMVAEK